MDRIKAQTKGGKDTDHKTKDVSGIIEAQKDIRRAGHHAIPDDPYRQLRVTIAAVFNSWMGRRACDYRRINRIPDDLGTAVNVQAMVFGNMGANSGTGVAFTRNPSTGKKELYGEYLLNAQGEDVVAGTRTPNPISQLKKELPKVYEQFNAITQLLEKHYRDMQDCEFTIERGKLWMLQTRTGKRTVTARGGMASHAAVGARGMGKTCVSGATALEVDYSQQQFSVNGEVVTKGEWITVDGSTGRVFLGKVPTVQPSLGPDFYELMKWADDFRTLTVRANADTPHDARVARSMGAEGIGLCRTEHMFFGDKRLASMRQMILADGTGAREKALEQLLPLQRGDFVGIFREMAGFPVTIRLLDPPLHEFLPNVDELLGELSELKMALRHASTLADMDHLLDEIDEKRQLLHHVNKIREANPMLGFRGCRLGLLYPEVTRMQCRAIFEAAIQVKGERKQAELEIMVPLVSVSEELAHQKDLIDEVARQVMGEHGLKIEYEVGTMIELPRAALTADRIAEHAAFFSFGTNDLTQTTFGLSRDDSGRFLPAYIDRKILADDPFQVLDTEGVGELVRIGAERGRSVKPDLKIGICGEHGGDPQANSFCNEIGLNYVSCSPYRVPVARLAAAQATLAVKSKAEVAANGEHAQAREAAVASQL